MSRARGTARVLGVRDPVSVLPGAGPATAARLVAAGLTTVGELLGYLPRGYDDLRVRTPIGELDAAAVGRVVVVQGVVQRTHIFPRRFLDVTLADGGATLRARWFRPPGGMARSYVKGSTVTLAGPLRLGDQGQPELIHPLNLTAAVRDGATLGIRARYAAIDGIGGRVLEKMLAAAVDACVGVDDDPLAAPLCRRLGLPTLGQAWRMLHRPDPASDGDTGALAALLGGRTPAHRRLALAQLLPLHLGFAWRRAQTGGLAARPCPALATDAAVALAGLLPFALTPGQRDAWREIAVDLAASRPMQRLLIGDVGSGKTAVALLAAAQVARAGGQTLLMAPTEVLAEQHRRTLSALGAPMGLRVALLTAATSRADREALRARCRRGDVDLIVGTQALLDLPGDCADLRLCIVDEQHRFGVGQRARLRQGGARGGGADAGAVPHLLVMSATPIPRSLAHTLYGDLDATLITDRPPGRPPTTTVLATTDDARAAAYAALAAAVAAGGQGFVVCPARETSARAGGVTALGHHRVLRKRLAPARVGLLHGALPSDEKEVVLRAFAGGALDVLVATTVVELGIDVPNATVMVIEEADRFGLAQLHQLRGRVGRGTQPGVCYLLTGNENDGGEVPAALAQERLRRLADTSDGFKVAEADLALRGPGELFGVRQAGAAPLAFADLPGTMALSELARAEAARLIGGDPTLELPGHADLRAAVTQRWSAAAFTEDAG